MTKQLTRQLDTRPIILYDIDSQLSTRVLTKVLKYGNIRYAPLQSAVGDLLLRRMSDEIRNEVIVNKETANETGDEENIYKSSIVVCDSNKTFVKSSALLEIMRLLTRTANPDDKGVEHSKRFKLMQYLALLSYVVPNRLRDRLYDVAIKRKRWFSLKNTSLNSHDDRYMDDALLTDGKETSTNLFESADPPTRGSRIKIVYTSSTAPSITYDEEFPNGLCLIGGTKAFSPCHSVTY